MKKKMKVSLLVFVKNKYKYSKKEEDLVVLVDKLGGKYIGGGTDLSTGKRDQQYYFSSLSDAKTFLSYKTTQETILKDYDLQELDNV